MTRRVKKDEPEHEPTEKKLWHPIALSISVFFLVLLAVYYFAVSGDIKVSNSHYIFDKECMYCDRPATREVEVSLFVDESRFRESDRYFINAQTFERTKTGYVPRKDTYLVLDEKGWKVETERHWAEKEYSDGSFDKTDVVGDYCALHQYAGERLIGREALKAQTVRNPVFLTLAALSVLPLIYIFIVTVKGLKNAMSGQDAEEAAKSGGKLKKLYVVSGAVLVVMLALYLILPPVVEAAKVKGDLKRTYDEADALMADGKYEDASNTFLALGDYEDSAERAKNASYEWASSLFDKGEYDEAAVVFAELGDYKDSAERVESSGAEKKYVEAVALLEGEPEEQGQAKEIFEELGGYKDAKKYLDGFVLRNISYTSDEGEDVHYLYNKKGQISAVKVRDQVLYEHTYNSDGDLIKMGDVTYEYSADKKTVTQTSNAKNNKYTTVQVYNEQGLVISSARTGSGAVSVNYEYEYNADGAVAKKTAVNTQALGGSTVVTTYEYDAKGLCAKEVETRTFDRDKEKGRSPSSVATRVNTYDTDGNLIRVEEDYTSYRYSDYSDDVKTSTTHYTLEYEYGWVYAPEAEE